MWICKKCNEENEDNFDTCYKCQTYSEEGALKSKDYQQELDKEQVPNVMDNPPNAKNRFLALLPGLFVFICFISAIFYPTHTNFYHNSKNSSLKVSNMNYNDFETFKAVFSNTVKGWLPNNKEWKDWIKYKENLDRHYYIKETDYFFHFAAFLPYLMIVSLIIIWIRRIN